MDLAAAKWRWPAFAPEALAEGFRSIQAVPMRLRGQVIGALNLFGRATGPLSGQDLEVARALADTATIGILQERAIRRGEVLTEQMQGALTSRIIIEQAKGMLSQAATIPTEEAFEKLRCYSRNHNVKLSDVAERLMRGELPIDAL